MGETLQKHKDLTLEKGRRNEERFFEAMNDVSAKNLPPWILRAHRPTSKQDKYEGIDAIIETSDVGRLFVQIKSSTAGEEKFKKGRHFQRNRSFVVVVVSNYDTPESIRVKTRKLLSELRWEYFKHVCNICNK